LQDVAGVDEAKEDLQEIVEFCAIAAVQKLGRAYPARRFAGRPSWHRQDLLGGAIAGEANVPSSRFRVRIS